MRPNTSRNPLALLLALLLLLLTTLPAQGNGSTWSPAVSVRLNGRALRAGEFRFKLTDVTGQSDLVMHGATGTNTASGSVSFPQVNYTAADAGKSETTEKVGL